MLLRLLFLGAAILTVGGPVLRAQIPLSNDAPALEKQILDAYEAETGKVTIAPGTYHVAPPAGKSVCFTFTRLKNFEIDATGVTFIGTDKTARFLSFNDCSNVTLRGASFRHDPVPFSQGAVVVVGQGRDSLDMRIPAGYSDNPSEYGIGGSTGSSLVNFFDPQTRTLKRGTYDIHYSQVERVAPRVVRFHFKTPLPSSFPVEVGDLAAWRGHGGSDLTLTGCGQMKVLDVNFSSCTGFVVHETQGEGGDFYRYKVTRGPPPTGATESPLLASNADAFHSSNMRHGPTLDHCYFEYNGDDGVPIHGSYVMVVGAWGSTVEVAATFPAYCRPGDTFHLYDRRGCLVGDAKVVEVAEDRSFQPTATPAAATHMFHNFEESWARSRGGNPLYLKITLDQAVPVPPYGLAVNASTLGNGFVVRNCTVIHSRARGMLIQADDGLIEDNVIESCAIAGILVCPEMHTYTDADYARHLVVRRNIIRDVGTFDSESSYQAGAVTIAEYRPEEGFVPRPGGHRDITVEENTFEDDNVVNILVSSAQNIAIRNNTFVHPLIRPVKRGTRIGVPGGALIWVTQSSGVSVDGNQVVDAGPYLKSVVQKTSSAINVEENGAPLR